MSKGEVLREEGFQIHPLGSGTRIWVSRCLLSRPFCSFPLILLSCSLVFVAFLRISCDLPRSPMRAVSLGPWVLGRVGEVSWLASLPLPRPGRVFLDSVSCSFWEPRSSKACLQYFVFGGISSPWFWSKREGLGEQIFSR